MRIRSFEFELDNPIPTEKDTLVVSNYMPPVKEQQEAKKGRAYIPKEREVYGPWLEKTFYDNEIARYFDKFKTDKEIQYELLSQFTSRRLRHRFKTYKETINHLRTQYNRRDLYAAQEPHYLLSLRYDDSGIITVDGRGYKYLYFIEAYKRCIEYKIADPRFIEPEKIEELRNRINSSDPLWNGWVVPDAEWIKRFEHKIQQPAYNSVHFPIGWTREESPEDID